MSVGAWGSNSTPPPFFWEELPIEITKIRGTKITMIVEQYFFHLTLECDDPPTPASHTHTFSESYLRP